MARENTREGRFQRHAGGLVLGGAVTGYFLLPALRYAEPWVIGVAGVLLGIGIAILYEHAVVIGDAKKRKIWPSLLPICIGIMLLIVGLIGAIVTGFHAERVCLTIQKELLGEKTPSPVKNGGDTSNAADRFQALGCHYQSYKPYSPLMIFE